MKYGITDLAEILGITTSAIRYFEKEHLINAGKEKNGHRYYNEEDVFRLLSYTKYRTMDIPMKQIVRQFSGEENDWKRIREREQSARDKALEKAEYYSKLAENIQRQIVSINLIENLEGRYEFEKSPARIKDAGGSARRDRHKNQCSSGWHICRKYGCV